jgi:hypothetical protein
MKKLAMGTMMMSAVLLIAASACQAAGRDWDNRGGDRSGWSRGGDRDGGFNRGFDRDERNWVRGSDRDDRDRGPATIYHSPAYRPVYVCPPPVYRPARVYVERPSYRTGFSFSFSW